MTHRLKWEQDELDYRAEIKRLRDIEDANAQAVSNKIRSQKKTIERQAALLRQCKEALMYYDFANGVPQAAVAAIESFELSIMIAALLSV